MSDLKRDLQALAPHVDTTTAWEQVVSGVPPRRRRLVAQRVALGLVLATSFVALGVALRPALDAPPATDTTLPVNTTNPPESTSLPFSGAPSQSAQDAERDGVVAELAAVPYDVRVSGLISVDSDEGSWVVSRPSDALREFAAAQGCRLGEVGATLPPICADEYGELLLVRDGEIVRAYPSASGPPTWAHVASEAVYAGRTGDGALPHSTIMRVDRTTQAADAIVFSQPDAEPISSFPSWWRMATDTEAGMYPRLVGFADAGMEGLPVSSWVGDLVIDLDGIRALFASGELVSSTGLVRVDDLARCGLQCFDVTLAHAEPVEDSDVYPPDASFGDPTAIRLDCSGDAVSVEPVDDLDPTWDGNTTGCEAVLALGRWAWISPYFRLDESDRSVSLRQVSGPWVSTSPEKPGCFGSPDDPPMCDLGHAVEPDVPRPYITIESVSFEEGMVRLSGTEWDIAYVDTAYLVRGTIGPRTVEVECSTSVEAPSPRGPEWKRLLDACLLAELYEHGERFDGVFEVVILDSEAWGLAHRPEISLP